MEKRNVIEPGITPDYKKQAEADADEKEQAARFDKKDCNEFKCCGKTKCCKELVKTLLSE